MPGVSQPASAPEPAFAVSARTAWWLAFGLIAYGSLYPLQFAAPAAADWHEFIASWGARSSLGDILGNIALFIPYGVCGILGLHGRYGGATRMLLVVVSAVVFALVLQGAQLFLPARVPALIDVMWNAIGVALGIAACYPLATRLASRDLPATELPVPALLLAAWVIIELLPLVPSLDYESLKNSFKPLLLTPQWNTVDALLAASGVFTIGHLLLALRPRRAAWRALIALVLAAVVGKIVILTQALSVAVLSGWVLGMIAVAACDQLDHGRRAVLVFWTLFASHTIAALEPFVFSAQARAFNWVPFADVLTGRMLNNASALAQRLFAYAVLLWLCPRRRLWATALGLASWMTLLEFAQTWLPGRVPTISEPLWVVLVAWLIASVRGAAPSALRTGGRQEMYSTVGHTRTLVGAGLTVACFAAVLWFMVRIPGVPYNVRELLHGNASILSCVLFAIACLWFGAGSIMLASRIRAARVVPLSIAGWGVVVGIVSLLLMMLGVTNESIRDIAGSNNLYYFVTEYQIWGAIGKSLFEALPGPDFVAFLERPVRYATLFAPLFTALALAHIALSATRAERSQVKWLIVAAIPWLWLCKGVAFDFSSTDNLNELITRPGAFGLGGGGYLYLLLATVAMVSAGLANACSARSWTLAVIALAASLPAGWWLVNLGLEGTITKYGVTFSGVQFLLGPDRSHALSSVELAMRWTVLYLGVVAVFMGGMRIALGLTARAPATAPQKKHRGQTPTATSTLGVRLASSDIVFITQLAERSGRTPAAVVTQIVASQLSEKDAATLISELLRARAARLADDVDHTLAIELSGSEPAVQALAALAEQAGVSVSRAIRRLVSAFIREMNEPAGETTA